MSAIARLHLDHKVVNMCLSCGCMDAHLEIGTANITFEDVKAAADENGRAAPRPIRSTGCVRVAD